MKAFFLLIPLLAAAAPQKDEWFLAGREGSCVPLSVLAKRGDDLKDVQSPYQLVEKMRAAGQKAELKEYKAGTRPAVEVTPQSVRLRKKVLKQSDRPRRRQERDE